MYKSHSTKPPDYRTWLTMWSAEYGSSVNLCPVVVSPVVPSLLSNIKRGHLYSRRTKLYLYVVCLYDKPTIYKHIYKCAFVDLSSTLTLILLTWRIWWDSNNASKWQTGFNSAFKGLKTFFNAQKWTIYMYSALLPFHSFIPLACAECDDFLPFSGASSNPLCYILFPATLLHQLFDHPLSPHLAIYFLVCLSNLLFPNSYTIILFWEFYFLPFSVHAQTNIIYLTYYLYYSMFFLILA